MSRDEEDPFREAQSAAIEIAPQASAAAIKAKVEAAIVIALKFPRDETAAFAALMKACQRPSFAEDASYSFKRGRKPDPDHEGRWIDNIVSGPSINLAREAARVWGNVKHGVVVIMDDEDVRTIEATAWDLQTNTEVSAQDTFAKLIWRKNKGAEGGYWIKPDERDLRELTNRRAAILKRNCILEILPKDLIEDARDLADKTILQKVTEDPEGQRKKIIIAFGTLNITPEMLEVFFDGRKLNQISPAEVVQLKKIFTSIRDGNSTWGDYVKAATETGPEKGKINLSDLKPGKAPDKPEDEKPKKEGKGGKARGKDKPAESVAAETPRAKEDAPQGGPASVSADEVPGFEAPGSTKRAEEPESLFS